MTKQFRSADEITIDITKLKPFNCKHFANRTRLTISSSMGYCKLKNEYCVPKECNEYEEMEE